MDSHTNIFHVYASKLEASRLSNAHVLHICPAFFSDLFRGWQEFFCSSQIFSLIELQQYIVPGICKSILKRCFFIGIISDGLYYGSPLFLPIAFFCRNTVRTGLYSWLSLVTWGCSVVQVSSRPLSNLGMQDRVKRKHLKRMYFFNPDM